MALSSVPPDRPSTRVGAATVRPGGRLGNRHTIPSVDGHAPPRPASTIVLVRPGTRGLEILLTRRPESMAFAAGMHVFPGGRVDERDADARLGADAHAVAAIRELFEEAGVLLLDGPAVMGPPEVVDDVRARVLAGEIGLAEVCETLGGLPACGALAPISRWVTPPIMPRRFDARFFAAELPAGAEPRFDPGEVIDHAWMTASDALEALAAGSIGLWLPTVVTLLHLEHVRTFSEIRDLLAPAAEPGPVRTERLADDVARIVQPAAAGVAGLETNGYLVGRRELLAVDPGDPSEEVFVAFEAAAADAGGSIVAIAITAPTAEHVGGAEGMAIRLGIPVVGGSGAGRRLPFDVGELSPGEKLPGDHGLAVASAGEGVAFVREDLAVAGDLAGDPPARTIRPPLARPARWAPALVLPGHGPVSGAATRAGSAGG